MDSRFSAFRTPLSWSALLAALTLTACDSAPVSPTLAPSTQGLDAKASASPAADSDDDATDDGPDIRRLKHLVVIYLENRSFDNLYGEFPGANGLPASIQYPQVDANGTPYQTLPAIPNSAIAFPTNLANAPFSIEQYAAPDVKTRDLVHRYYQEQTQIDGGKMDKFALVSDAKGLVMGYYHTMNLPLAHEVSNYTVCDNFFHGAFGGSFLNHFWLIAAQTPTFPGAPTSGIAQLDALGNLVKDGFVTPDGRGEHDLHGQQPASRHGPGGEPGPESDLPEHR